MKFIPRDTDEVCSYVPEHGGHKVYFKGHRFVKVGSSKLVCKRCGKTVNGTVVSSKRGKKKE